MFKVETDVKRNLMTITYSGNVEPLELVLGRPNLTAALTTVRPGFRLLTDLSGLIEMEYACATGVEAMMDLVRKKGVTEVVRVVPDPHKDIGFKVMSFFHYGRAVPVLTCDTLAEALEKLAPS